MVQTWDTRGYPRPNMNKNQLGLISPFSRANHQARKRKTGGFRRKAIIFVLLGIVVLGVVIFVVYVNQPSDNRSNGIEQTASKEEKAVVVENQQPGAK